MEKLTQQEQVRRQKMQDLIDMGIDPFGSKCIILYNNQRSFASF